MKIKTGPNEKTKNIHISEFPDSFQDFLYMILNPSFYEFTIQNIKMKNNKENKNEQTIESGKYSKFIKNPSFFLREK